MSEQPTTSPETPAEASSPQASPLESSAAPTQDSGLSTQDSTPAPELSADAMPLLQVIEAILFSTDIPLTAGKLAEIVGVDSTKPIKQTIEQLNQSYEA